MAETLSLDGIDKKVHAAMVQDISALESYRAQLTGPITSALGHSPERKERIEALVGRIDFELAARVVESAMEMDASSTEVFAKRIEETLGEFARIASARHEALEAVS